jgi:hypothetical protein
MKKANYLAGMLMAMKEAGDVAVRMPDLNKKEAPATKPREQQADQGRTTDAPDPAPDTKPDQTPQEQTVKKSWADLPGTEREYLKGIVKACQEHNVNAAALVPVAYVKAAAAELKQEAR